MPTSLRVFLLLITASGLICAAFGLYFWIHAGTAASWPMVEGQVVGTVVERRSSANPRWSSPEERERRGVFYPQVNYRWQLDGRSYQGSIYQWGQGTNLGRFGSRDEARQALAPYRAGARVPVFVDPSDPSSAVLNPSRDWSAGLPLLIGVLLSAAGGGGWWRLRSLPRFAAKASAGRRLDA